MKIAAACAVLLGLFCATALVAQDLTVAYVDGTVELMRGSAWKPLAIGDSVPAKGSLRVVGASFLELAGPTAVVKLSKSGTYAIEDLIKASQGVQKVNLGSLVAGRVAKLTQQTAGDRSSAVGGVRASKAVDQKLSWAGDEDVEKLLADGIAALQSGKWTDAENLFQEAKDFGDPDQGRKASFYVAYSSYARGQSSLALKALKALEVRSADDFFGTYVVTYATLLLESMAYPEALSVLGAYGGSDRDTNQTVLFLKGMALKLSGKPAEAKVQFGAARDIDAANDTGKAALQQLADL